MPIYEYHCNDCNTDFEKLVFGSNPEVACERCGSKKTEKLMSRFGMGRSSNSSTQRSRQQFGLRRLFIIVLRRV